MSKIENAEQLIKYLNNWDYGKTCFEDTIIYNYVINCEIHGDFEEWDYDVDNIPDSYIESKVEQYSYEDTNGIDELDPIIVERFDSDIEDFINAIKNHITEVNTFIKNKSDDIDKLSKLLENPGKNYSDEILNEIINIIKA